MPVTAQKSKENSATLSKKEQRGGKSIKPVKSALRIGQRSTHQNVNTAIHQKINNTNPVLRSRSSKIAPLIKSKASKEPGEEDKKIKEQAPVGIKLKDQGALPMDNTGTDGVSGSAGSKIKGAAKAKIKKDKATLPEAEKKEEDKAVKGMTEEKDTPDNAKVPLAKGKGETRESDNEKAVLGSRQIEINKPQFDGLAEQHQARVTASRGKAKAELKTGSAEKLKQGAKGIKQLAKNEKRKKGAAVKVAETQAAVQETAGDKRQEMNSAQVDVMGKKKKPVAKEEKAKKDSAGAIQELVRNITTLDDLDNIKSKMPDMTSDVMNTVNEQTGTITDTYKELDTVGKKPHKVTKAPAIPSFEKAVKTPQLNLGKNLVPKVKEDQLKFIEETDKETDNLFAKEGLDMPGVKEVADKITTGDIGKANASRKKLKQKTKTGKKDIRKAETAAHIKLDKDLQKEESTAKQGMRAERNKNLNAAAKKQGGTKSKIEKKRKAVTDRINGIYEKANKIVAGKLKQLEFGSMSDFDKAQAKATSELEENIRSRMKAFKDIRYSGLIGKGRWVKDLFSDITELPEPKRIFKEEREKYIIKIDNAIATITKASKNVIQECHKTVVDARKEIKNYVRTLSRDVKGAGLNAQKEIQGKLDELNKKVEEKQKALVAKLSEKREAAIKAIDEKIEDLKTEMGPILNRLGKFLLDALMKVFEWALIAAGKSPTEIMGILKKTRKTITSIVTDPIGFFKNVGAAVGGGFKNFKNNFGKHLQNALVGWLTGAAGGTLQIPKKFNLMGVFTMAISALDIGWGFIRKVLVTHIGEPVVKAAETGYDLITKVVQEGPMALWDEIKAKLTGLKDMVIDAIKTWAVTQIVKKASIKLLTMLNPAGAFVQAVLLIYDTVMFFIENWDRIVEFVKSIFNSIGDIAAGKIGSAAKYIEKMLGLGLTMLMSFLARFVGLGGIAKKIKGVLNKLRKKIQGAIRKAAKKIAKKIKGWFGKKKGKGDAKKIKEDNKKGKVEKITAKDKKKHKKITGKIAAQLKKSKIKGNESFEDFHKRKRKEGVKLEDKYQPQLKKGINLDVKFKPINEDKKDGDIDIRVKIAPNNTTEDIKVKGHKDEITKIKVKRSRFRTSTKWSLAESSPKQHEKPIGDKKPRLNKGLDRRHVISSYNMASHYNTVLNGKKWTKAKEILSPKKAVENPVSNKTIQKAARTLHKDFFNDIRNLFIGDSSENRSIGANLDRPKDWTERIWKKHLKYIKDTYTLDDTFKLLND